MGKNAQKRRQARKHATSASRKPDGEKQLSWIPVELPRSADKHWFAPQTFGLLDERTVKKLGLIWAALYACRMGPEVEPGGQQALPLFPIKIHYSHLSALTLTALESSGVPARTETPFRFSYSDVLSPCLPNGVNKERFFNNLVDVMYCYWSILRGLAFLHELGLVQKAKQSRDSLDSFAAFIERSQGVPKDRVKGEADRGLNLEMMQAKWFTDATIVRIRALWDKLMTWLSCDYYCVNLDSDKWGGRDRGRVGEMVSKVLNELGDGVERSQLDAFISQCCELEELRKYRDTDLHQTSPRIKEALGRPDRDADMFDLYQMLERETARSTEGLMTCFAVILAAGGKIPGA